MFAQRSAMRHEPVAERGCWYYPLSYTSICSWLKPEWRVRLYSAVLQHRLPRTSGSHSRADATRSQQKKESAARLPS